MDYGCTLHLVKEESIREEFVSRVLGREPDTKRDAEPVKGRGFSFFGLRWGAPPETVLDLKQRGHPDRAGNPPSSGRRWRNMRLALEKREPHVAARRLSELAIRFASKELRYALVDERQVVLSNWHEWKNEGLPDLPSHLLPSPEDVLFRDVVAAYPRVAGYFHIGFDGEPAPGLFVPEANVAPLLAWLRDNVLTLLDPQERRVFRDVVNVLEYAQQHGYAYWEAMGLDVEESSAAIFARTPPPAAKGLRKHVIPEPEPSTAGGYTCFWGPLERLWIISERDQRTTVCFDLGTWPPREIGRPTGFLVGPTLSRDGRLLAKRYMPSASTYALGYFHGGSDSHLSFGDSTWRPLAIDHEDDAPGTPRLGWMGSRAVALFARQRDLEPQLFVQDGDRFVPGPALPPLLPGGPSVDGWWTPHSGFTTLASGESLLIWDGYAYRLDAAGLTRCYDLGAAGYAGDWRTVATPEGGFFFLSISRLYELRANGAVIRHARDIDNIMQVMAGPEGTLLLHQGGNSEADIGKLYDPRDGSYASLTREMFGFDELWEHFDSIFWSRATDSIVVMYKCVLHALPTRVVLDLPRRMPRPESHLSRGFEVISEPAAGHGARVARLPASYLPDMEERLRILLSNGRLTRALRLGIDILDDGVVGEVTVLTPDPEVNAARFADVVRKEVGPFRPPSCGTVTVEVSMRHVSPRERRRSR
jgi:hypothetical protein